MTNHFIRLLKTRPWTTNLTSAAILMTMGDAMAQYIEHNPHAVAQLKSSASGDVESWLQLHLLSNTTNHDDDCDNTHNDDDDAKYNKQTLDMRHYRHADNDHTNSEDRYCFQLDKIRTLSMIGWSIGIHTPIYMRLYQFYDCAFPKTTPMSVFLRVTISCAMTAPTNALFFTYGTCAHHLLEEVDNVHMQCRPYNTCNSELYQQQPLIQQDLQCMVRRMAQETQLKLQREYWDTLIRTYQVWTPINVVNFALVPAHLRTLMMCTCTMFWNCYLSLAQHRDVIVLPDENGYNNEYNANADGYVSAATVRC